MSGLVPYSDFKFIEIAHQPIGQKWPSRNQIHTIDSFITHFKNLKLGESLDLYSWYKSVHRHSKFFQDHVHKNGSVAKYEGDHILDAAVIESDGKDFPESARFLFGELLPKLAEYGLDAKNILVDPSGNKGFHLEIGSGYFQPTPHPKLYKIHEFFIRALLKFPESYFGQGQKIDTATYQICRLLRLRGTKNVQKDGVEESHRGFKINLNGTLYSLRDNPESVYELWKKPNQEALGYEYLSGAWHWQQKPNSRLQDLWKECQSRIDDSEKKRVFVPDSQKNVVKRRVKLGDIPDCLKALENMALVEPERVKEQNLRNYITCAITTFYAEAGLSDAWVLAHVLGIMRNCIAPDFTEDEIVTTVKTKLAGDNSGSRYSFGCGRETGFPSCLYKFCSESGELKDCPVHKAKQEKKSDSLVSIGTAVREAMSNFDRGFAPYFTGIPELDNFFGPLQPNNKAILAAAQSSGKTMLKMGFFDNYAKTAKSRKEILLFIAPEDQPEAMAKKWLIRKASMTVKKLFEVGSQGISQHILDWFDLYDDTIYLWKVKQRTVKEISNAIDAAEQLTGRQVVIGGYDGATFLRAENKFAKIAEADVAQELAEIASTRKDFRLIYTIHLPKSVMQDAKKAGKSEIGARPGLSAPYGSNLHSIGAQLQLSLWQEEGFMLLAAEKAKEHWDGQIKLPDEICLAYDRYFRWYTLDQAMQAINEGHQDWFETDIRSTYMLREQRKKMKKHNFKISEMDE